VATTNGERRGRRDGVVLGLLADPDLPAALAEQLARELPGLLAERLDDQVSWQVRVLCERFDLDDEDRLLQVARTAGPGKAGTWWSARPTCPAGAACDRSSPRPG
jgi:hypothetical protein